MLNWTIFMNKLDMIGRIILLGAAASISYGAYHLLTVTREPVQSLQGRVTGESRLMEKYGFTIQTKHNKFVSFSTGNISGPALDSLIDTGDLIQINNFTEYGNYGKMINSPEDVTILEKVK